MKFMTITLPKPQGSTMVDNDHACDVPKLPKLELPRWRIAMVCLLAWAAQTSWLAAQEALTIPAEVVAPGEHADFSLQSPLRSTDAPDTPGVLSVSVSPQDFRRVLERLDAAEAELKRLKQTKPEDKIDGKPAVSAASSKQPVQPAPEVAPLGGGAGMPDNPDYGDSRQLDNIPDEFFETVVRNSGRPSMILRGRIMGDTFNVSQSGGNKAQVGDVPNGFAWRQMRFGIQGDAYDNVYYQVEMDFAGGPAFKSTYLGFTQIPLLGNVMMGYFKQPFSLEEMPTEENLVFMERSSAGGAFVPGRQTGVKFLNSSENKRNTYSAGLYYTDTSDEFADNVSNNLARSVTTRMTWLPYYDEPSGGRYYWHLGSSFLAGRPWQNQVDFNARPEVDGYPTNTTGAPVNSVPNFIKTGHINAQAMQLLGTESAVVWNSLLIQGEAMLARVNQNTADGPDLAFWGGYLQASYFLTGEYRPYDRFQGFLTRVYPNERFFTADIRRNGDRRIVMGRGAIEVASRVSYTNLNSHNIQGGTLTDYTAAISWFANPHTRFEFNYIHAFLNVSGTGSQADFFLTRFIQSF